MLKTLIGTTDPQNYAQYLNEKIENVVNLFKKNNYLRAKDYKTT